MAHFFGTVTGKAKTQASRCGTKASRLETIAASWQGAVKVSLSHDDTTGQDIASVELMPWHGSGTFRVLYRGPILRACDNRRDVIREIRDTLVHELGHHFGMEEEDMPY